VQEFQLKKVLSALLFSTSEPLALKDVQAVFTRFHQEFPEGKEAEEGVAGDGAEEGLETDSRPAEALRIKVPSLLTASQIRAAFEEIQADCEAQESVWRLREGPRGWAMVVAPEWGLWVRLHRRNPRPRRLSQAQMETLAVVAYRQPVTRAEIEAIRGVAVDNALSKLLDRDLIHVSGRAEQPGRPLQYATTKRFLEFVGLTHLEQLPGSDVIAPQQLSEWIQRATEPSTPEPQGLKNP
jgi:segregation and condensation protein B